MERCLDEAESALAVRRSSLGFSGRESMAVTGGGLGGTQERYGNAYKIWVVQIRL
jgi:hypothetical protein